MSEHVHTFDRFHYCTACGMTREQVFNPERLPSPALADRRLAQLGLREAARRGIALPAPGATRYE